MLSDGEILGAVISVVGTAATVVVYLLGKRRERKRLVFDYKAARIDKFANSFGGKLSVSFDGRTVERASLVGVTFRNAGAVAIQRADFDLPLRITFDIRTVIAAQQITDQRPKDLQLRAELEGKH